MRDLLRRVGRSRLIAAAVVVVTSGLLIGVARMVFFHPAESAIQPGIVMTGAPRPTSPRVSQSSSSTTPVPTPSETSGGASSTSNDQRGTETGSSGPSDSSTSVRSPQAVEPDPPVAVDHGSRRPAPPAPSAPSGAGRSDDSRPDVDDDDDDRIPARNGVTDRDDDRDLDD